MFEWKINVEVTVFTTVYAAERQDAYEAASEEIKRYLPEGLFQVNDFDLYDCNEVETD